MKNWELHHDQNHPRPPPETENVSTYKSIDSKKLHECALRAPPSPAKPRSSDDRPLQIFTVAPDINTQALLAYAYETFSSATTLTLDLSDDLEGKDRNLAQAIHQMLELGLLLIEKALDNEYPVKPVGA
ncbi:DUF6124 family protein [Pseudomonas fluorescens]|uniref:DUF3077 domain-containing protein n=1 Tax=Pseudomonas fluorescens TaxID=294 RepID=A0A5E7DBA2_PSEFL|nr:DUF6124 family protein [Pseudomonas fluorescens]VVO09115.1 hypothetical protein PS691_03256 [Pseudomonas fluorescens]